jgi:hypothetical protein
MTGLQFFFYPKQASIRKSELRPWLRPCAA